MAKIETKTVMLNPVSRGGGNKLRGLLEDGWQIAAENKPLLTSMTTYTLTREKG